MRIGTIIFLITYALISTRKLHKLHFSRPVVVSLASIACILFRIMTPREAWNAIDGNTILLLFGMMGVSVV